MRFEVKKRNTPIATLIKNYANKKSGKVADSRKEILWRFNYLDWKDQKKIILSFFDSGKTDRQWAYSRALDYWDKSFEAKVKELWESYHEERCSWVVIRHFPVEYLSKNINQFTEGRDYFFICLRLAESKDFLIDKNKLSLTDYLAVLYHTGRSIADDEAKDIPYIIVHKICVEGFQGFERQLDRYANSSNGNVISPIHFQDVNLALYYLRKLNCLQIASQFEEWNEEVQRTVFESLEFKAITNSDLDDWNNRIGRINIARKYAYLALDDKYKKNSDPEIESILESKEWFVEPIIKEKASRSSTQEPSDPTVLKEMIDQNPAIEKLVGSMGLETGDNTLPF